jgi:hypothetical protein
MYVYRTAHHGHADKTNIRDLLAEGLSKYLASLVLAEWDGPEFNRRLPYLLRYLQDGLRLAYESNGHTFTIGELLRAGTKDMKSALPRLRSMLSDLRAEIPMSELLSDQESEEILDPAINAEDQEVSEQSRQELFDGMLEIDFPAHSGRRTTSYRQAFLAALEISYGTGVHFPPTSVASLVSISLDFYRNFVQESHELVKEIVTNEAKKSAYGFGLPMAITSFTPMRHRNLWALVLTCFRFPRRRARPFHRYASTSLRNPSPATTKSTRLVFCPRNEG